VVGGWWLVVGGWWLVVGGWWLVVGGWWLVVGGWLYFLGYYYKNIVMAKSRSSRKTSRKMPVSGNDSSKKSRRRKRVIKDTDILAILKVRDDLLANTTDEAKKEEIHMACKGLFACPKSATDAEKSKCFDTVRSKLKKLGGKLSGGARRKSRSRSRSRRSRK
jgi:hypothetical protein